MAKSWLVDGRAIARKVKTCYLPLPHQIKDYGANWECPQCHCKIDNSDVSLEWPGLPAGVKFDPSDIELIEHLAAKCGVANEKPHQFIDEFIATLDVEEGICYKHPENLPGTRKDGSSVHFFYRTTNAYTTGQRKRRKICNKSTLTNDVRWHKTGKTKAIMQNGVQIGCKKIMVLYGASVGGSKPYKLNWVMHQYHLGTDEDEKEGEYVVSKIIYQPQKQIEKNGNDNRVVIEESDAWKSRTSPRTPKTAAPDPRRLGMSVSYDDATNDCFLRSPPEESECVDQKYLTSSSIGEHKNNMELVPWEDDSEAIDLDASDDSLFCKEILDTCVPLGDSRPNHNRLSGSSICNNDTSGAVGCANSGITDLENLDLDTPPDFNLADLQFSSQDSVFGWIDWL